MKTTSMLFLCASFALVGCERWLDGLYAPIPPYQEPAVEDMLSPSWKEMTTPDLEIMTPTNLRTREVADGVSLEWSPLEGVSRYEVRIDGGEWQGVGTDAMFLDVQAPPAEISTLRVTATQAKFREYVGLDLGADIQSGAMRTYAVRAVYTSGTSEASEDVVAQRVEASPQEIALERSTPGDPSTFEIIATIMSDVLLYQDNTAPESGAALRYRVRTRSKKGEDIKSATVEGFKLAAIQVDANGSTTCAVQNDGALICWGCLGLNDTGVVPQLCGDTAAYTPRQIPFETRVRSVSVGVGHACALLETDEVHCWGWTNLLFPMGTDNREVIGDDPSEMPPPAINLGGPVRSVRVQNKHSCAIMMNGDAKCWGEGADGNLGNSSTQDIGDGVNKMPPSPIFENGLPFDDIIPSPASTNGQISGTKLLAYTCKLGHSLDCFGDNSYLQLGYRKSFADTYFGQKRGDKANELIRLPAPSPIPGVLSAALGARFVCGLLPSREVICWGDAPGDETTSIIGLRDEDLPPAPINVGGMVQTIEAGSETICAILLDNSLTCWGTNLNGLLGQGNTMPRGDSPGDMPVPSIELGGEVKQVSVGITHACVLLNNGRIKCWGANNQGQLGNPNLEENIGDEPGEMPPPYVPLFSQD